jgi:hypothetical protein
MKIISFSCHCAAADDAVAAARPDDGGDDYGDGADDVWLCRMLYVYLFEKINRFYYFWHSYKLYFCYAALQKFVFQQKTHKQTDNTHKFNFIFCRVN